MFGGYGLPLVMTISWIIIISVAVNFLVYDREAGQEEVTNCFKFPSTISWDRVHFVILGSVLIFRNLTFREGGAKFEC